MLRRFSLYGFLKNQRYFEPFLVLAFLDKGLTFTLIGLLIAWREIWVNLLEVPSGALADLWGRRRCMIISFSSYVVSFLLFGLAPGFWLLLPAMFFFAIGEAFRTGTHKAMIFSWLRKEGRTDERTRVYGYTRSWSKLGSALSALLASAFVLLSGDYEAIFYITAVPYALGVINFLGYPSYLDRSAESTPGIAEVFRHLRNTCLDAMRDSSLRRLLLESMGFEGLFKSVKDYLQPVLQASAALLFAGAITVQGLDTPARTALLVGPLYFVLHFLSAVASRNAYRLVGRAGSEDRAARLHWTLATLLFATLLPLLYLEWYAASIACFVAFHVLQDLWRPVLVSRLDARGAEDQGATLLSLENQAKSLGTMMLAPLLGITVDLVQSNGPGGPFWPVAAAGIVITTLFLATHVSAKEQESFPPA